MGSETMIFIMKMAGDFLVTVIEIAEKIHNYIILKQE